MPWLFSMPEFQPTGHSSGPTLGASFVEHDNTDYEPHTLLRNRRPKAFEVKGKAALWVLSVCVDVQ